MQIMAFCNPIINAFIVDLIKPDIFAFSIREKVYLFDRHFFFFGSRRGGEVRRIIA